MVRRYAAVNLRRLMQDVYNKINITFPPEFGDPVITKLDDGFTAHFAPNIRMQGQVGGKMRSYCAIGEGDTPVQALTNLLAEYADESNYDTIALEDTASRCSIVFMMMPQPYGTTTFRQLGIFPNG